MTFSLSFIFFSTCTDWKRDVLFTCVNRNGASIVYRPILLFSIWWMGFFSFSDRPTFFHIFSSVFFHIFRPQNVEKNLETQKMGFSPWNGNSFTFSWTISSYFKWNFVVTIKNYFFFTLLYAICKLYEFFLMFTLT